MALKAHGAALWCEGVGVTYPGGLTAIRDISLDVRDGEIVVILGSSGAGKSTLLRTLNLLIWPTTGTVETRELGPICNPKVARLHRRRTAMIFQQHQLIGRHSSLANVLVGRLGYHGMVRSLFPLPRSECERGLECLARVGLHHKALERVSRLSGGEQQRVGIARALVQDPKFILADEPVASLDPATARRVLTVLHRVCKEDGIPAIINLHQVSFAREFADRVIGLAEGRVVFDGAPDQLTPERLRAIYGESAAEQGGATAPNGADDGPPSDRIGSAISPRTEPITAEMGA